MYKIEGKVALVTGALGGIGKCYTRELLRNNIKGVALLDINDKNAESFQKELDVEFGARKTIFIKIDLADTLQIEEAFKKIVRHFKQLDIVINNAGILEENDVLKSMQVNFVAVAFSTNLAYSKYLDIYRKGEEGIIVNTASVAGLYPFPVMASYCSCKHAVVTMGRLLGNDVHYNNKKVRVLTICPGGTSTPIVDTMNNYLPDYLKEPVKDLMKGFTSSMQSPESLGKALVEVIRNGKNGSVWAVMHDNPAEEVDFSPIDNVMFQYIQ